MYSFVCELPCRDSCEAKVRWFFDPNGEIAERECHAVEFMGTVKGLMNPSYRKFKEGKALTRKESMKAQCYECNGYSVERSDDCMGVSCALYQWSPWGKGIVRRSVKRSVSSDRVKGRA